MWALNWYKKQGSNTYEVCVVNDILGEIELPLPNIKGVVEEVITINGTVEICN